MRLTFLKTGRRSGESAAVDCGEAKAVNCGVETGEVIMPNVAGTRLGVSFLRSTHSSNRSSRFRLSMLLAGGVALAIMSTASSANAAVLFSQDFSASSTVSTYASNGSPNSGQWDAVSTSNASGTAITITSGALQYARTANAGAFSRTTDFSPTPTSLMCKWILRCQETRLLKQLQPYGSSVLDSPLLTARKRILRFIRDWA